MFTKCWWNWHLISFQAGFWPRVLLCSPYCLIFRFIINSYLIPFVSIVGILSNVAIFYTLIGKERKELNRKKLKNRNVTSQLDVLYIKVDIFGLHRLFWDFDNGIFLTLKFIIQYYGTKVQGAILKKFSHKFITTYS